MHELLTTKQMTAADNGAVVRGISGLTLMENAGRACADAIIARWPRAERVSVLCGPGNNGGDGFVIARLLQEYGFAVRLGLLGRVLALRGDAACMAETWQGEIEALTADLLPGADLIVDAILGAGLARPVDGELAKLIEAINERTCPVIAVDVPSGVDGTSGAVRGVALRADLTVTFFRKKPGHLLLPGRLHCGETIVAAIGIPESVLEDIAPKSFENTPDLWRGVFPRRTSDDHKYDRGHAVAVSGGLTSTGAARLGARAALRAGAGLVTVASPAAALTVNASHLTAIMLVRADSGQDIADLLADRRKNAILLGPGNGVGEGTRAKVRAALASGAACVLDADALTSFAPVPGALWQAVRALPARPAVLTPHAGEFARLFPGLADKETKLDQAGQAAAQAGAVIVLKGADTVIAAPDGRCAINTNAPATLATAGSGDVLAGIVCGLLAQGMPAFEAACASVWLHGEAARLFGPGLIAEDITEQLPQVLRELSDVRK